jgi:archaellum biogenesis ATPase FlaH
MEKREILERLNPLDFYCRFVPSLKDNGRREAMGFCPFHDDHNPSLSVNLETGLFHCFGCQAGGDVFAFYQKLKGVPFTDALRDIGHMTGLEGKPTAPKVVGTFEYHDESGQVVYLKQRIEPGRNGQKKEFIFYHMEEGRKVPGRGRDPIPFNLPKILTAIGPIYLTEGEAKADLLNEWGLTATSFDTGSSVPSTATLKNWRRTYLPYFQGKEGVIIIPDNDDPGRKYATFLASELKAIAGSIKIVNLPGLSPKGDVIDWFKAGGTREQFIDLVEQTREWAADGRPFLKSWKEVYNSSVEVEYLVDRLIPKNAITVLFGRGGIGKTWLALELARCIGGGSPFLGLETQQTPVIYVDFENPLAVLTSRTQKLGETEGVFFWLANDDVKKAPKLDSSDWEAYKTLPKGSLIIFDTLRSSQSRDEDKSQDMANVMGRLKELRDLGFTVVILHHTAKNNDRAAKGSTAIVDLADHILGLTMVKKRQDGKEVIVDDEEDQGDTLFRFGWREKTRFEPFHLYLTLNPDRGFELAPDPQEKTLESMREILMNLGPCSKGVFYEACKRTLDFGEKKVRGLLDHGDGRFWDLGKGTCKNLKTIVPKTLKPAYHTADLNNPAYVKPAKDNADYVSEDQYQPADFINKGNSEEGICRFADLNPHEGVL